MVSIPSQAGTLFGRRARGHGRRNLSSQYPLRRAPSSDEGVLLDTVWINLVSIPSQAGTLFGRDERQDVRLRADCLNTLSGGHPLRTGWTTVVRLSLSRLNTLSGGHPLRTREPAKPLL